jgi:hypothetical protein
MRACHRPKCRVKRGLNGGRIIIGAVTDRAILNVDNIGQAIRQRPID